MTPRELAEKISATYLSQDYRIVVESDRRADIESLLTAAFEENRHHENKVHLEGPYRCMRCKQEAYDECIELCRQHGSMCEHEGCCVLVAEKIRQRQAEVEAGE